MTASRQSAPTAASAQVPIRSPLARGRPRLPVGGGFGSCSTALAGSRVVQVSLAMTRDSPWNAASPVPWTSRPGNASASSLTICAASCGWEAGPLPRHRPKSTGSPGREREKPRRDHPLLAEANLLPPLGGPVIGPPRLGHVLSPPAEEGPVHRHRHRLALAEQGLSHHTRDRQAAGAPRP